HGRVRAESEAGGGRRRSARRDAPVPAVRPGQGLHHARPCRWPAEVTGPAAIHQRPRERSRGRFSIPGAGPSQLVVAVSRWLWIGRSRIDHHAAPAPSSIITAATRKLRAPITPTSQPNSTRAKTVKSCVTEDEKPCAS